jgi:hypothetical protein
MFDFRPELWLFVQVHGLSAAGSFSLHRVPIVHFFPGLMASTCVCLRLPLWAVPLATATTHFGQANVIALAVRPVAGYFK